MIGKNLNLISRIFFILLVCVLANQFAYSQEHGKIEEKAVVYFCNNVQHIKRGLIDYNIRFKWQTTGRPSRVYNIADCIGDISLIKDSIPDRTEIEKIESLIESKDYQIVEIAPVTDFNFLKKHVFTPFNNRVYTLQVFNAIEYKGVHFVELCLVNRNLQTWVIGVEFNQNGEPIGHCMSSITY